MRHLGTVFVVVSVFRTVQSSDAGRAGRCRQRLVEEHAFSFTKSCMALKLEGPEVYRMVSSA